MTEPSREQRPAARRSSIAQQLRVGIYDNTYPPGSKLPTVRALMEQHAVANQTAQDALALLRTWGLAESRGPEGTFVCEIPGVVHPRERLARMAAGFSPLSPGETSRITDAGWFDDGPVPDAVRQALGIDEGQRVARRVGVVLRGDRVAELTVVWHPQRAAEAAPALLETQPLREGGTVGTLLRAGIEVEPSASEYTLGAGNAAGWEAQLLGCQSGDALLRVRTTRVDPDGVPVELLEMCYPPQVQLVELPAA